MSSRQLESLVNLIYEGRKLNNRGECNYVESLDWLNKVHEALTPYPEAQDRFRLFCFECVLAIEDKREWALKILTDVVKTDKRGRGEGGVHSNDSGRGLFID